MKKILIVLFLIFAYTQQYAQNTNFIDSLIPVRGFCIESPKPQTVGKFIKFIKQELVPRNVNTLILRVDYNYHYKSHPELADSIALTRSDVKKLVKVCKDNGIKIIPQFNLLGHQSWAGKTHRLLTAYPQFDENPEIDTKNHIDYKWPNSDGYYCKSYCPLHPDVHKVVFEVIDELIDVFETDAFHAGMDEVFYIGNKHCKRCFGRNKAELFANEVNLIRNHIAKKNCKLWIWGDRLLDGTTTGLGEWEASKNNTHRAIDLIYKDVFICDWHYGYPHKTLIYFAIKGFKVATSGWKKHKVNTQEFDDVINFRNLTSPEIRNNLQGFILTVWSSAEDYLDNLYSKKLGEKTKKLLTVFEGTNKYK